MNRLHSVVAALFLALWVPATSLCLFEVAADMETSACCPTEDSGKGPGNDVELSACCFLASALFKVDGWGVPGLAEFFAADLTGIFAAIQPDPRPCVGSGTIAPTPPEIRVAWQFHTRAAPPPRAPSAA